MSGCNCVTNTLIPTVDGAAWQQADFAEQRLPKEATPQSLDNRRDEL